MILPFLTGVATNGTIAAFLVFLYDLVADILVVIHQVIVVGVIIIIIRSKVNLSPSPGRLIFFNKTGSI